MKIIKLYFLEIIGALLIIMLFGLAIDYSFESKRADKTFNSGVISIEDQEIKMPIKISDLEKKFGEISFKSETYDGGDQYQYNNNSDDTLLSKHSTAEGTLNIQGVNYGVIITNIEDEDLNIDECYMVGIHLNDSVVLFKYIKNNLSTDKMNKILKTGFLNPYKTKNGDFIQYKKDYIVEISNYEDKDVLYYYDYDSCKEKKCNFD